MKKIVKDLSITLVAKVLFPLFNFISIYVFSKILSIEEFGTISYLLTLIIMLETLFSLSLSEGLIFKLSKDKTVKKSLSSTITLFSFIIFLLFFISIPVKVLIFPNFSNILYILIILNIYALGIFNLFNFSDHGLEKFFQKTFFSGLRAVLKLIPIFLYFLTKKAEYIFVGELITLLVPLIIYFYLYRKDLVFKIFFKELKTLFNFSKYVHGVKIVGNLSLLITQTFLFSLSVKSFALYYAAIKLTTIITSLPLSIITVAAPKFFKNNKSDRFLSYLKLSIKYISLFYGYLLILLISFSEKLIPFIYSQEFSGSTIVFNITIIAIVLDYTIYLANPRLSAISIKNSAKAHIFKQVFTLILSFFLITKYLELGAGLSLLISSVIGNFLLLRYSSEVFDKNFYLNSIMVSGLVFLIVFVNVFYSLNPVLIILFSTVSYVMFLFLTRLVKLKDLKKMKKYVLN